MDKIVISSRFITLLIHSDGNISQDTAEALVRSALKHSGLAPWHGIRIELFPGRESTLLMAAPLDGISVRIAPYALPFFGLFTE